MKYRTTIKVLFPHSPSSVYRALTDLDKFSLWNSGMKSISGSGPMMVGMDFKTVSIVLGRENRATVQVVKLVANKEIQLRNDTGDITFLARYRLSPRGESQTEVVCTLSFELVGMALNFAHKVIESMAKSRIKGDLQTLRALID